MCAESVSVSVLSICHSAFTIDVSRFCRCIFVHYNFFCTNFRFGVVFATLFYHFASFDVVFRLPWAKERRNKVKKIYVIIVSVCDCVCCRLNQTLRKFIGDKSKTLILYAKHCINLACHFLSYQTLYSNVFPRNSFNYRTFYGRISEITNGR